MPQIVKPPIQPSEAVWLSIDFGAKDALIAGDSLSTLLSFVCTRESDGVDVTNDLVTVGTPTIVGNKVTFLKKQDGGVSGQKYKATAKVRTALLEVLEEDLVMEIQED